MLTCSGLSCVLVNETKKMKVRSVLVVILLWLSLEEHAVHVVSS